MNGSFSIDPGTTTSIPVPFIGCAFGKSSSKTGWNGLPFVVLQIEYRIVNLALSSICLIEIHREA